MNNIIVIGKGGYIGGYITKYLRSQETYNIIAPSSTDCNFLNLEEVIRFFSSLDSEKFDVIFTAVINKSKNDSFESFTNNIQMVNNFIEGQKRANISSITYLSSVDVYGINPITPITEATKINPDNWYGLSKYVSEWNLLNSKKSNCPIAILRLPGVYGKSANDKSVVRRLITAIAEKKVTISGKGEILRDYVFIEDVTRIVRHFIKNPHTGIYNLVTGKPYSLNAIVKVIKECTHTEFEIEYQIGKNQRLFDLTFDNSKLREAIPELKFSTLELGLKNYFHKCSKER